MHVKLSKFTEPDQVKEPLTKITFELVEADNKTIDDPPVSSETTSAAGSPVTQQPVQVRPANSTSEQYGVIDVGRVRKPGYFSRIKRI